MSINVTTNLKINERNKAIEMTKQFAKAASRFGTDEYYALQEARKNHPRYTVVTKKTSSNRKTSYKGLTYDFMEKYIKLHDDEKETIMNEFKLLVPEDTDEEKVPYIEVKDWFLEQFPEIRDYKRHYRTLLVA